MSSSDLFISPKASPGYIPESSESSLEARPLSESACFLFDGSSSQKYNEGLYQNYSQWFRNDSSLYHKSEMRLCGIDAGVVNPSNRHPLDSSDLECKERLSGSSFFPFGKNSDASDNDSNECHRFKDIFDENVRRVANESIYCKPSNSKISPDALLEHHIARPELVTCKNNLSPKVTSRSPDKVVYSGGKPISRQRAKAGRMFFVTVTFDYQVMMADKFIILSNMYMSNNTIVSYCIASEQCEKSEKAVSHIHSFFEFQDPVFILEICKYLREIYVHCRLDIQPCRSKKSCLKNITKKVKNVTFEQSFHLQSNNKTKWIKTPGEQGKYLVEIPLWDTSDVQNLPSTQWWQKVNKKARFLSSSLSDPLFNQSNILLKSILDRLKKTKDVVKRWRWAHGQLGS